MILPFAENLRKKDSAKMDFLIFSPLHPNQGTKTRGVMREQIMIQDFLIFSPMQAKEKGSVRNLVDTPHFLKN